MECKWKINIVPCDKANKLIKVFSLPPCLADARVAGGDGVGRESGIELFFFHLPPASVRLRLGFVLLAAGLKSALTLAAHRLVSQQSQPGLFP